VPRADSLVERVLGLMLPLGPVEARRMFGGHGLYVDGIIFALVFDGALFLKADERTSADFARQGLGPLTYEGRGGKTIALPYWQCPVALLKDGKALCRWARKAHGAALRFEARKKPKRKPLGDKAAKPRAAGAKPRFEPDF
jgi:DNA transformation protein